MNEVEIRSKIFDLLSFKANGWNKYAKEAEDEILAEFKRLEGENKTLKLKLEQQFQNRDGEYDPISVPLWYLKKLEKFYEDNKHIYDGLENIKKHLEIVGGDAVKLSATYNMVVALLKSNKPEENTEDE